VQVEEIFSNRPVYALQTSKGRILFKLLSNKKYNTIAYVMKNYPYFKSDLEDDIWDECVLQHSISTNKDHMDAGVITTIAQLILFFSSPRTIDQANQELYEKRIELANIKEQAIITICQAFPAYLPEVLEDMSWEILLKRLAQAEIILEKEFEFKSTTSQSEDDSDKIFSRLDEYTNETIDFSRANKELNKEEFGAPRGNYNLHDIRGE